MNQTASAIILVVVLISAIGMTWFLTKEKSPSRLSDENSEVVENVVESIPENYFASDTQNIKFQIPEGWSVANDYNETLPRGINEIHFALVKKDTSCAIVHGEIDFGRNVGEGSSTYRQISFGERVFSKANQWDSNWYAPVEVVPSSFEFSGDVRQYLPNEIRTSAYFELGRFTLYTTDGIPVPDECDTDLSGLLRSIKRHFQPITLTPSSVGTLSVLNEIVEHESSKRKNYLIFTDSGTKENYVVTELPKNTDWTERFFVVDSSTIYFTGNTYTPPPMSTSGQILGQAKYDAFIYKANPFTKEVTILSKLGFPGEYISSLFVNGSDIYFIKGSEKFGWCLIGYGDCRGNLYKTTTTGETPTLLAKNVFPGILSYRANEEMLYLVRGTGDAGCLSYSFMNFQKGVTTDLGTYGGCLGDEGNDNAEVNEALNLVRVFGENPDSEVTKTILVQDGKLSPGAREGNLPTTFWFEK